eukprot:COSAG05_NODE_9533_length_618_cov_0.639692_1_plen_101_part_00
MAVARVRVAQLQWVLVPPHIVFAVCTVESHADACEYIETIDAGCAFWHADYDDLEPGGAVASEDSRARWPAALRLCAQCCAQLPLLVLYSSCTWYLQVQL